MVNPLQCNDLQRQVLFLLSTSPAIRDYTLKTTAKGKLCRHELYELTVTWMAKYGCKNMGREASAGCLSFFSTQASCPNRIQRAGTHRSQPGPRRHETGVSPTQTPAKSTMLKLLPPELHLSSPIFTQVDLTSPNMLVRPSNPCQSVPIRADPRSSVVIIDASSPPHQNAANKALIVWL